MRAPNPLVTRRDVLAVGVSLAAVAALPAAIAKRQQRASFDWKLYRPETVGMSRAGLKGVRAAIQKYIDDHELTGAVTAIARYNRLAWFEAQGVWNTKTSAPMRKDGIFRMMSSSKPVVAVCVLMMMDEGKLSIEDPVSRFIPTFKDPKVAMLPEGSEKLWRDLTRRLLEKKITLPAYFAERQKLASQVKVVPADREVTLKDLLTHTAGLSTFLSLSVPTPNIVPSETLAERVPLLGSALLDFQPGTRWAYSPVDGFDVLLRIVEIVSGMPADEFMRRRLFEPLEMTDTGFHLSAKQRNRLVPLYARQGNAWKETTGILLDGAPKMKYLSGSGGLLSTVHDYMQFEEMLLNRGELNGKRVLKPEAVAMMSSNQVGSLFEQALFGRKGNGFGLGVAIVLDPAASGCGRGRGSFGWDGSLGTDAWVDPEHRLTAAYFVQQAVRPALCAFGLAIDKAIVA